MCRIGSDGNRGSTDPNSVDTDCNSTAEQLASVLSTSPSPGNSCRVVNTRRQMPCRASAAECAEGPDKKDTIFDSPSGDNSTGFKHLHSQLATFTFDGRLVAITDNGTVQGDKSEDALTALGSRGPALPAKPALPLTS